MNQIEYSQNVVSQTLVLVSGFGVARSAEPSSRYAIHMAGTSELLREIIEHMSRVAGTSEQDDVPSAPAPVENLEPDTVVHRYELGVVGREVLPREGLTLCETKQRQSNERGNDAPRRGHILGYSF